MVMMNYYNVAVSGRAYHSKKPLTYAHESLLKPGTLVTVPVRSKKLTGYILEIVSKPEFAVKDITRIDDNPPLPNPSIELHKWMESYYPTTSGVNLQLFMPNSILKNDKHKTPAATAVHTTTENVHPALRLEQTKVINQITESKSKTFLLHGETGSGKTRVYAELANEALKAKKSVLILTPEIGLTAQLVSNLKDLTNHPVITLHSQLTPKEKRLEWKKIANDKKGIVVIATRSGLFAPFQSLGLIVVDEAHEDAYKQDNSPHYHATRVAAKLGQLHGANVILGSATPSVVDYALFDSKQLPILKMSSTEGMDDLTYELVDLKDRSLFGTSPHLSSPLIKRIASALASKEQALVYLNRRGTARLVLCQQCGWENICKNCDIPLTFHADKHEMRCHTCGDALPPPSTCPVCSSPDIFYKQIGTKALISHIEKLFPEAKVARFDTDVGKSERLEARYEAVHSGEIDILVGTQLLSKGLDLPKLSTIGVIQADSSLTVPDFSAREKTYQQLHQITGRVARGHRKGHVVIQTHNPDSPLLKAAAKKDYSTFLDGELKERKQFLYPPFCYLLKITYSRRDNTAAQRLAEKSLGQIHKLKLRVRIAGPSPSFKAKTSGNYNWQIVIKSKDRGHLTNIITTLPPTARYDIDPINLL